MFPNDGPERADYLLGAIAVALAVGFVGGLVVNVPLAFAGGVGSLLATVPMADALSRPP